MYGFNPNYYAKSGIELSQDEEAYRNFVRQRNADYEQLMKERLTNAKFAKEDSVFIKLCETAGVEATPRQASKYRNKYGAAYNAKV